MGTARYLAPEQVNGRPTDAAHRRVRARPPALRDALRPSAVRRRHRRRHRDGPAHHVRAPDPSATPRRAAGARRHRAPVHGARSRPSIRRRRAQCEPRSPRFASIHRERPRRHAPTRHRPPTPAAPPKAGDPRHGAAAGRRGSGSRSCSCSRSWPRSLRSSSCSDDQSKSPTPSYEHAGDRSTRRRLRRASAAPIAGRSLRDDDADLAARASRGDRRALETLLDRHADRVHALCRRVIAHREDALDATQEAMIAIARGIDRFDGRSAFTTWMYRVVTNAALDELRRKQRRPDPVDITDRRPPGAWSRPRQRRQRAARRRRRAGDAAHRLPRRGRAARPPRPRLRADRRGARDPGGHRSLPDRPRVAPCSPPRSGTRTAPSERLSTDG